MTSSKLSLLGSVALTALATLLFSGSAQAQMPMPTAQTPGMIGGQTIGSGKFVIGAATGYPETNFRAIWGLGDNFDLSIQPGLTYAGGRGRGRRDISSLRQDVGLDFQVPLRWTIAHMPKAAVALRLSPFFRIGEAAPALSVGGLFGARFSIPLPKIFSIVVGPEARFAFAHINSAGGGNNWNFFDGAVYAVVGLETYFKNKWHFNMQMDMGGYFGSNGAWDGPLYNVYFGFGVEL